MGPLADRVVLLSGLNEQNTQGTKEFMNIVGLESVVQPAEHASFDSAAARGKPTLVVASPVPYGENALKSVRENIAKGYFGRIAVELQYHPHMALIETNFVRDFPGEYLTAAYHRLTVAMMEIQSLGFANIPAESIES